MLQLEDNGVLNNYAYKMTINIILIIYFIRYLTRFYILIIPPSIERKKKKKTFVPDNGMYFDALKTVLTAFKTKKNNVLTIV